MERGKVINQILESAEYDDLVTLRKLLKFYNPDLNCQVVIGQEYDLDEYDEVPLLFYLVMNHVSLEAILLMLDSGLDLDITNSEGLSVVDLAIKFHRVDILELCRAKGFDFNETKRKSGMTPLMLAAAFNDVEILTYLLKEGVNPDKIDKKGMSALDYAKKMRHKKAQEVLESMIKEPIKNIDPALKPL
jgi:ankyrin repeat protein